MSGSILPFEGRRHAEAQRLLPWLLTQKLDDDERPWLEAHVSSCSDCQKELGQLRALRDACTQAGDESIDRSDAGAGCAISGEVDRGWRRLRPRLQSSPSMSEPARPQAAGRRPHWLGWAVVAQAATLAALAWAWWPPSTPPAHYRTLGAEPAAAAGNLVIAFDPHLDESQLRHLLLTSQARIVDGPNDAGAYVLAVPTERLPMVRDALRAAPGVTLVAALGPAPRQ